MQKGIAIVPKSVQETHMKQNLQLKKLPENFFIEVDQLASKHGFIRFLDPSRHLGFDIFDEENDQPLGNSAPWD